MKKCPYCSYSNYDNADTCRKCDSPFVAASQTVYRGRTYSIGPQRAKKIRSRALFLVVLGLLITVYWGGYSPWPPVDFPTLAKVRAVVQPLLLIGGGALYVLGWIAAFV